MKTLVEFLTGDVSFIYPAPGGSIANRAEFSKLDADYYLAELAAMIKLRKMGHLEIIDTLTRKAEQVRLQRHYGKIEDRLIIERIREWIGEIDHACYS